MISRTRLRAAWMTGAAALLATAAAGSAQAPTNPLQGFRAVYSGGFTSDLYVADGVSPAVPITSGRDRDVNPDWSKDGATIVFQRMDPRGKTAHIWAVAPDGSNLRQISRGAGFDRTPRISPDGTKIAFTRRLGNHPSAVWMMNIDGSAAHRIVKKRVFYGESMPAWSPDGTRIVYDRLTGSRPNADIYVMNADGTNQRQLVASRGADGEPDFTPDGQRVLFSRESAKVPRRPASLASDIRYNLEIWSVSASGGDLKRLTNRKGDDYQPRVSPDGTRYTYNVDTKCPGKACNVDVWVGYLDGVTPAVQLTSDTSFESGAAWGTPAAPGATPTLPAPSTPTP